jgi:hypothetical protein
VPPAVFPTIVTALNVAVPASCRIAEAAFTEVLPLIVTFVSVMSASLAIAPPVLPESFPLSVTRFRVSGPLPLFV